ncbi:hypothetical protein GCM10023212_31650 [Luteolibacter yonseiensis]
MDVDRARQAWEDYQGRKYLRKAYSVFGSRWYDPDAPIGGTPSWHSNSGAWVNGGAWIEVVHNAIAIAESLGRDTQKLNDLLKRKIPPQ